MSKSPIDTGSDSSMVMVSQTDDGLSSFHDDPPVIVGMACRLPGDIRSTNDLWNFLINEKSGQGPVPPERYNLKGYYHPDGSRSGSSNVPGGYFINEDLRTFDNGFFGINNLEATYMDPQQRKLLEVTYEALESSGATMESLSGSLTGVYVGNFSVDYQPNQTRDPDYIHRYTSTGTGATIMSNRISHVFNLHGPSFTVDTACSSSIYALHQALSAMRLGDCESAIVASANMVLSPELHVMAAKSGVLSPTGTCHTFDASADGYGRAEGVNAIYIKRLSAALRDGNSIKAVIRGSATNASGRTPGISLPSGEQQEAVIRKAYKNAGLELKDTDYVECHGTGTPVGDPIEVNAVGKCFAEPPREGPPLLIGSVKTNVGHSEGASGLTSVLKVATAFEKGKVPPSRGVIKLNPKLILSERNVKIATKVEEWPRALRRASVNSFGYGGANAHVILESIESYFGQSPLVKQPYMNGVAEVDKKLFVLPVSAASAKAFESRVAQITQAVAGTHDEKTLQDLAHTLSKGRDHLRYRGYILAKTGGRVPSTDESGSSKTINALPFGFVFTGQGAQYPEMGKGLLERSTHFRNTIRSLDAVLKALPEPYVPDWTLEQTILDGPRTSRINEVTRSQPICTAVQIGLVEMLRSWGIEAEKVVGHSSGEIGAAYTAGLLTQSQAILVAYYRGYAVGTLRSKGGMVAAGLNVESAKALLESKKIESHVRVACVNAPESVTIAGSPEGIETVIAELQSQNKFVRRLETGGRAYHSRMMEEIGPLYEQLLTPLFGKSEKVTASKVDKPKMYSSVGFSANELRVLSKNVNMAKYWRQNLEQPVQFSAALSSLAAGGRIHLVELGPHAALKGPISQIRTSIGLNKENLPYSSTLVRKSDADACLKTLAGSLFTYGHALDWSRVDELPESGLKLINDLQPYPWDYSAGLLWSEPRISTEQRNRKNIRHELLGTLALTGNGIDYTWRNLLRPSEMPWINDHKLEEQVVFPGAGYMAMAIEAVTQLKDAKAKPAAQLAYEFRNVNISTALNVPAESDAAAKDLELHTTMAPRRISGANSSADWCDFSISSWAAGQTTTHCTGSVRMTQPVTKTNDDSITVEDTKFFDEWPASRWYKQWHQEGFCFGPNFQSIIKFKTDNGWIRREAIATTKLEAPKAAVGGSDYPVHPIVIDAAIQAAIWSTTAGQVKTLKAWFPVFIPECTIQPAQSTEPEAVAEIHVRSEETGFSSRRMAATLRDVRGAPVVDFRDARIALYTGKKLQASSSDNPLDIYLKRQPMLRVNWKPDIMRLGSDVEAPLKAYVARYVEQQQEDMLDDESLVVIGALIDLAGHKNPRMRVLELGGDALGYKAQEWLKILDQGTAFARSQSWSAGDVDEKGEAVIKDGHEGPFEVLLIPKHATSKKVWAQDPQKFTSLVSDRGIVITRKSASAVDVLQTAGFVTVDVGKQVLLGVRTSKTSVLKGRNAFIVIVEKSSAAVAEFADSLATFLREQAGIAKVSVISLDQIDTVEIVKEDVCISLLEMEREFLATISPRNTDRLRLMTDTVTDLLWITGSNMLGDVPDPNLTLSNGLSRALMLEQPALRYTIVDVGPLGLLKGKLADTCVHVLKALIPSHTKDDCEFIERHGLLSISRYEIVPDFNNLFRRRLEPSNSIEKQPLADARPAQLSINRVGAAETIHFQQLSHQTSPIPAGHVDIDVKAVGLTAKDVGAILGRVERRKKTTAFDFSGVVTSVGADTKGLSVGDRVVAYAPHNLSTNVRVPTGSVHKLLPSEDFVTLPSLLLGYATALYALKDRAQLRPGESILIHDSSDSFGVEAVTLAQNVGAVVYATVSSDAKRDYLIDTLGLPAANVFGSSQLASITSTLKELTGGRGVDVVINSLTGDLLHESWRALAEFGRFVEVGRRDIDDAGILDMRIFLRNATFTAFELSDLYYAENSFNRAIWDRLLVDTLDLYRSGAIRKPSIDVFDVSEISQAYQHFTSSKDHVRKVVVSFEHARSPISVVPATYETLFNPDKVYLMIGCLGGLGRSLSRWMMSRGARRFVFQGRSGADRPSARDLVARLEDAGARVSIARGDVSKPEDVSAAVKACLDMGVPIGGVVQAAMGLHEALFTRMTNEAWHTGIDPKWQGTWNLHNSLEGHDSELDFFLCTSSVSGTVGTATEANYCAANGFLDSFARWRRSQGKPCVAVGLGMISEVGYLHENPEIEALLLRKGIQPINEEEMLQIIDIALTSEAEHRPEDAHLLTGLEPAGIRSLNDQGFDVTEHGVLIEARASILLASLHAEFEAKDKASGATGSSADVAAAPWFKEIPASLTATFAPEADAESVQVAALNLIKKRFSNLILMPAKDIDDRRPLPDFGVDSMIASEFRSWFWTAFKVDIPFLHLMNAQKSLAALAEFVAEKLPAA